MTLVYRLREGKPAIVGSWADWQAQIPGLPDEPTTDDVEKQGGTVVTVHHENGDRTETVGFFDTHVTKRGERFGWAFPVATPEPSRTGTCQVCGLYSEHLYKRLDGSGVEGWTCDRHDETDTIFA